MFLFCSSTDNWIGSIGEKFNLLRKLQKIDEDEGDAINSIDEFVLVLTYLHSIQFTLSMAQLLRYVYQLEFILEFRIR